MLTINWDDNIELRVRDLWREAVEAHFYEQASLV